MPRKTDQSVASPQEVLQVLTAVMRADAMDAKVSERCKAAEDLGKHYGLFDKPEALHKRQSPSVRREIDAVIRELMA